MDLLSGCKSSEICSTENMRIFQRFHRKKCMCEFDESFKHWNPDILFVLSRIFGDHEALKN